MNHVGRGARRVLPVLPLAALSFIAASGPANAAGACPDPAVEATVNIDGSNVAGCRAIFEYTGVDQEFRAPGGADRARVLLVGGGGGGGNKNRSYSGSPDGGGSGGAGGQVINEMITLAACQSYTVAVGYGGEAAIASSGNFIGMSGATGGFSRFFLFGRPSVVPDASGGTGANFANSAYGQGGIVAQPGSTAAVQGTMYGGGGGGVGPGGTLGTGSGAPSGSGAAASNGAGGSGGVGINVSASFPGLTPTTYGSGGGGFGVITAGSASPGGGAGGKSGVNASNAVDGTGGGGGGGATMSNGTYHTAGNGGHGRVVVDYPVPANPSCSGGGGGSGENSSGGGASGGAASGGSSASTPADGGSSTTSMRTTAPRVSGGVITTSVTASEAGTAVLTGAPVGSPSVVACTANRSFTAAGTATMACVPGPAVQRMRRAKAVRVKITITFRPANSLTAQRLSVGTATLPKRKVRPIAVTG